ncbi:gamma-DL-glutamyl hydrolase precursor [mine drainage metagenome]|uniref:Gamma-DL-glutamyl hydrolase n=1 Tax=mine drainage metagenome TaxID=410659 RepID=A0A1J5PM19_9ZZZZ
MIDSHATLPVCSGPMRITTFFSCLLLSGAVHASPANVNDDMGNFLVEKGVLSHIQELGQNVTQRASDLVIHAIGFLGVPYRRGGNSGESGFDCSGFVKAVYEQTVGLILPRKAEQQAATTQKISEAELQPGDLVFFNTMRRAFSHVGIYIGDGKFVHSPKPGAEVRIENMDVRYWRSRFDGARRVQIGELDTPVTQSKSADQPVLR